MVIKISLNPEGHDNRISGSKVMTILLKGWSLPIGGASSVEGLRSTGLPRLVSGKGAFCLKNGVPKNGFPILFSKGDLGGEAFFFI